MKRKKVEFEFSVTPMWPTFGVFVLRSEIGTTGYRERFKAMHVADFADPISAASHAAKLAQFFEVHS